MTDTGKPQRLCSVEGCERKYMAHGFCKKHYYAEYNKDPERVARNNARSRAYRKTLTPEQLEKKRAAGREYARRPEVRARVNTKARARYQANIEENRRRSRERRLAHRQEVNDWLAVRKDQWRARMEEAKAYPCMDCGGRFPPVVMDFDHVRGEKKFGVSVAVQRGYAWKTIQAEMDKCELVCSNCHRIRTAERAGWVGTARGSL